MNYHEKQDKLIKIQSDLLNFLLPAVDTTKLDKAKLKKINNRFNKLKTKVWEAQ